MALFFIVYTIGMFIAMHIFLSNLCVIENLGDKEMKCFTIYMFGTVFWPIALVVYVITQMIRRTKIIMQNRSS